MRAGLNSGGSNKFYEADEADLTKDTPQVLGLSWSSGNAPSFYVEGRAVSADPTTAASGALYGADRLHIGGSTASGSGNDWDGNISEVIFYGDELDDDDRNKVESYLALKYGVTLDQSAAQSYTAPDGTQMWATTTTGASTHNNDIAGIGRDDDLSLIHI